jgi:glutamine amidotransferase
MTELFPNVKVCILDYSSGNVGSVLNLFKALLKNVTVSSDEAVIRESTHLVLPGVGAFGACMNRIHESLPLTTIEEEVFGKKKPFLGICVGLQVLADTGFEFGEHKGLGWIPGSVRKLEAGDLPLPHIGWNDIHMVRPCPLLEHFQDKQDFYFVHSYVFAPTKEKHIVATTTYGENFPSILNHDNIYGVQFHPEKSQKAGMLLIRNYLQMSVP